MNYDPSGHFVITISMLTTAAIIGAVAGTAVGGIYGGLTAAANKQNVWAGIGLGMLSGAFMGAGAGIAAVFIAPVLAGSSIMFATASGVGFSMGFTISTGAALAIGIGVAFGTGAIGGALTDIGTQLVNSGKVNDWSSVGWSALQGGIINTVNAFACGELESLGLLSIGSFSVMEASSITAIMNFAFGSIGLLIDVIRGHNSKKVFL